MSTIRYRKADRHRHDETIFVYSKSKSGFSKQKFHTIYTQQILYKISRI